jgi:hypothetical protein
MKIAVFGDSYADKTWRKDIWWQLLNTEHNHQVECFGESGSSILFSALKIDLLAQNYDLVIWALTTPGRFSLQNKDSTYHIWHAGDSSISSDPIMQKQISVCRDYLGYVFDWDQENFVGKSIVSYLQQKHNNIMIVPCFPAPLLVSFNLYNLCEQETNYYFPGKSIPDVYLEYQDLRPGHLTVNNQKILANLINQKLTPGIFQTDYSNFVKPKLALSQCFDKIKK